MKTLKAICTAAILALALSIPANAGDVETPGFAPPPPPPPSTSIAERSIEDTSVSRAPSSALGDIGSTGWEILWILASIF